MTEVKVQQYNAFTTTQGKGNPAGVILDGQGLTASQMQEVARLAGHSECCFVLPSQQADYRFRYFMPQCETPLCGHATIATLVAMAEQEGWDSDRTLTLETLAGILTLQYTARTREVVMTQAPAVFRPYRGEIAPLMAVIGLPPEAYDSSLPIVYGSTGAFTLILPIRSLDDFQQMTPNNQAFPTVLDEDSISIHPVVAGGFDPIHHFHGRHFGSARSGVVEDPVTGTASGVMGGYYLTYLSQANQAELLVEQGNEMGMEGTVRVMAQRTAEGISIAIAGTAVASGHKIIPISPPDSQE